MNSKLTSSIIFAFIIWLFFASSTWGVILIRDDGTSMNGSVDGSQLIHIKTQSGTLPLKIDDIFWAVGENVTKRIRLIKKIDRKPIIGEIESKDEIKIRKDEKELTMPFKSIVFFLNPLVEKYEQDHLKDYEAAGIYEYTDGFKLSLYKRTNPRTMSLLLPENWEGDITISNPNYPAKVRKGDSFDISFDIEGGKDYKNLYEKADSLSVCNFFEAIWKDSTKPVIEFPIPTSLSKVKSFLPISGGHKGTVKYSIYVWPNLSSGNGYFYLYLTAVTAKEKHSQDYERAMNQIEILETSLRNNGPHVYVYRTVSNVLRLPITIE